MKRFSPFRRFLLGAALTATTFSLSARAQISLNTAVDLAFHTDPKVLSAQAEVDRARAALSEAKDAYVPVVAAQGGVGRSTGVPLGGPPEVFSLSAQSLVFNWSQRDYIKSAHSGWDASRFALQQARDEAAEDVVTTYLQLDNAQQRRASAQAALDHARRLLQIVTERVQAGTDAHIEIPRADLTAVQLEQQLSHLDAEIAELSDHLARLTGLTGAAPRALHDSIPALPTSAQLAEGTASTAADSPAVKAAFANAQAKLSQARGDTRYLYRPQLSLGANYARITTAFSNYQLYYPGFNPSFHKDISYNSLAVGVSISLPLLDQAHRAKARQSAADARKAQYDALSAQNMFAEGRLKLQRSLTDLDFSERLAQDRAVIAQDELDAVLVQLAPGAAPVGEHPLTPKDEQNARLAIEQRRLDLLTAQLQLVQAKVSLMRQNGQLGGWVNSALNASPAARP